MRLNIDIIRTLKQDQALGRKFHNLSISDPHFASCATQFSLLWPIFEVKSSPHVSFKDSDDRKKIVESYFDEGAEVYAPPCWKRHEQEVTLEKIIDWPHTIDALYKVRCNLFHGEKVVSSENDKQIVSGALRILVYFFKEIMHGYAMT